MKHLNKVGKNRDGEISRNIRRKVPKFEWYSIPRFNFYETNDGG